MGDIKEFIEYEDRYFIPLENRTVSRCYVDTALGIQFFEDGPEITIRIEGHFLLVKDSRELKLQISEPETLGPMLRMIGNLVVSALAWKNGRLEILFQDGTQLLVESDPEYEAWELSRGDGFLLVSLPGGGLTAWQS